MAFTTPPSHPTMPVRATRGTGGLTGNLLTAQYSPYAALHR